MAVANRLRDTLGILARAFPGAKRVVPGAARRAVSAALYRRAMRQFPDRRYMTSAIIPQVCDGGAKRVLFIGCRDYTAGYPRLFAARGVQLWTIDIDPAVARWGAPGRHVAGDASRLDTIDDLPAFDAVVFSGILGFGIDDTPTARRSFLGFARILSPGALLVVGWNTDRSDDPIPLPECSRYFDRSRDPAVAGRRAFDASTHVYDFLVRNSTVAD